MTAPPDRPILRYHGGKWRLAPWVISHFPPHERYCEPFAGSASVLLQKPRCRGEILNDMHGRLVNAFRVIRDYPQDLRRALRFTPYAETEYIACREQSEDPVEDARRMLVLGHQAHGSTGASGKKSGWRRGIRPHGPSSADEWSRIWQYVEDWSDRLRGVYLENEDAFALLERWDSSKMLFYVDPPYLPETRQNPGGYLHDLTREDHVRLAEVLKGLQARVILSGYDNPLYREIFADWAMEEKSTVIDNQLRRTECLWLSPNIKQQRRLF